MTEDETKFEKFFLMLDSDQPGERQAALEKVHALRAAAPDRLPAFGDIYRALKDTAPRAEFDTLKGENARWVATNDALTQEIAALRAKLRSITLLPKLAAAAAGVVLLGFIGIQAIAAVWGPHAQPQAVAAPIETLAEVMQKVVSAESWAEGDTKPSLRMVAGEPYWFMLRSEVDAATHADAHGQPVARYCLHLFASKAMPGCISLRNPLVFSTASRGPRSRMTAGYQVHAN